MTHTPGSPHPRQYLCAVFSYLLQCLLSEDMFYDIFLYPPREGCTTLFSVIPLFSFKLSSHSLPVSQQVLSVPTADTSTCCMHPLFPISSLSKLQSVLISYCRNLLTSLLASAPIIHIYSNQRDLLKKNTTNQNQSCHSATETNCF